MCVTIVFCLLFAGAEMDPVCHAIATTNNTDLLIETYWSMQDVGGRWFFAEGKSPEDVGERVSIKGKLGQARIVLVQTGGASHFLGTESTNSGPAPAKLAVEKGSGSDDHSAGLGGGRGMRIKKPTSIVDAEISAGSRSQKVISTAAGAIKGKGTTDTEQKAWGRLDTLRITLRCDSRRGRRLTREAAVAGGHVTEQQRLEIEELERLLMEPSSFKDPIRPPCVELDVRDLQTYFQARDMERNNLI
jgi:hypothetical protein